MTDLGTADASKDGLQAVLAASTVCEAFQAAVEAGDERIALRSPGAEGGVTWREYGQRVRGLAAGLAALGLGRGQTLATHLSNRPEFHFIDMAALHLGAVPFGIYQTSTPKQICDRLENSDCRIYVAEKQFLPSVLEALDNTALSTA